MAKKRRSAGTFRMNISIPLTLKDRMDECDSVTWSHIAVRAFEEHLAEVAPTPIERKQAKEWKKTIDEIHELAKELRRRSGHVLDAAMKELASGLQEGSPA